MRRRGQTTLDFLIGTATFLIAIGLIVAFVPGLINPFTAGTEGHSVMADRTASTLTESALVKADEPFLLDKTATDDFFNKNSSTVKQQLGLPSTTGLNVTLSDESGQLESLGPPPSNNQAVSSAWRVVTYDGDRAELTVRIWG